MSKSMLIDDQEVLIRLAHSKITAAQYIRNVSGLSLTDSVAYLNKLIAAQPIVEPAKKESMWCDAIETKPVRSEEKPNLSVNVLFWVKGRISPFWGFYSYTHNDWVSTAPFNYDAEDVSYFAYIDNPYK